MSRNPSRLLPLAGLWPNPGYHKPGSAPGNGRVTSAIYRNGEEKAAVHWSLEIGIDGEGNEKLCELISWMRSIWNR